MAGGIVSGLLYWLVHNGLLNTPTCIIGLNPLGGTSVVTILYEDLDGDLHIYPRGGENKGAFVC